MIEKIFCINPPKLSHRRPNMTKMFEKYNLNYEFVDGVYYTDDIIQKYGLYFYCPNKLKKPAREYGLKQSVMAISFSHYLCAKKILELNLTYGCIIEDDIVFLDNL